MRVLLLVLSLSVLTFSCRKNKVKGGDSIEIYQLKSYKNVTGKCQVDFTSAILEDVPFVSNDEILEYNKATHEYRLTAVATDRVKTLGGKSPFAFAIDKAPIFYGFYMPPMMSSTCDHSITMDVSYSQSNIIGLKLGYPGWIQGHTDIDDQRNHPKILATLLKQGKLF